jgi:hypothetical protein
MLKLLMTIKEIIAILKVLPETTNIYIDLGDKLVGPWQHSVKPAEIELHARMIDEEKNYVSSRPCKETMNTKLGVVIYVK